MACEGTCTYDACHKARQILTCLSVMVSQLYSGSRPQCTFIGAEEGAYIDTPLRGQRSKRLPSVKQKSNALTMVSRLRSTPVQTSVRLPCPLGEVSLGVQHGTLCQLSPLRELGVPNFLLDGVLCFLLIFIKTFSLIF